MVRIGFLGDFHAHKYRENGGQSSLLITDKIKDRPIVHNPVESLKKLIKDKELAVDILVNLGDICDMGDIEGFKYVWTELEEISALLGTTDMVSTVGNHEVKRGAIEPFSLIKDNCAKGFPSFFDSLANKSFWENGFALISYPEFDLELLVVNSAYHHYKEDELENGKIDLDQLENLRMLLSQKAEYSIRVAIAHHPTILHERLGSPSFDFMSGGSELMEILDEYDFTLTIYGHKHDPRVKYSNLGPGGGAVFASGSFSCLSHLMLPGSLNTFHIAEIDASLVVPNCEKQGLIDTWHFVPSQGWKPLNTYLLPSRIGFGCTLTPKLLVEKAYEVLKTNCYIIESKKYFPMDWEEFLTHLPEIRYLPPENLKIFGRLCWEKYRIKVETELPKVPESIYLNEKVL